MYYPLQPEDTADSRWDTMIAPELPPQPPHPRPDLRWLQRFRDERWVEAGVVEKSRYWHFQHRPLCSLEGRWMLLVEGVRWEEVRNRRANFYRKDLIDRFDAIQLFEEGLSISAPVQLPTVTGAHTFTHVCVVENKVALHRSYSGKVWDRTMLTLPPPGPSIVRAAPEGYSKVVPTPFLQSIMSDRMYCVYHATEPDVLPREGELYGTLWRPDQPDVELHAGSLPGGFPRAVWHNQWLENRTLYLGPWVYELPGPPDPVPPRPDWGLAAKGSPGGQASVFG